MAVGAAAAPVQPSRRGRRGGVGGEPGYLSNNLTQYAALPPGQGGGRQVLFWDLGVREEEALFTAPLGLSPFPLLGRSGDMGLSLPLTFSTWGLFSA